MTLEQLLDQLEPKLRDAFRAAMNDWRNNVDYGALVDALERGDVDGAIAALNIERGVFNEYLATQTSAFARAAQFWALAINSAARANIQFRFDMSNPRAEDAIRNLAGDRITGYTDEQIRIARQTIVSGYVQGKGPQNIAVDIAGRINPITKRREGGIIGLSTPQAQYHQTVKDALERGDYRSLFIRDQKTGVLKPRFTRMDGRDIRILRSAVEKDKKLTEVQQQRVLARYTDRLIARRAEDVARTETAQATAIAKQESYQQALEKAGLPPDAITKMWIHAGADDRHARLQHIMMDGVKVTGLDSAFTLPDGTKMLYAHDPAGGAQQVINCRCDTRYIIDYGRI